MLDRLRRLLPAITWGGTCMADRDWEAEGWHVQIVWGRFVFEVQGAKIDRDIRQDLADAR